MTARIQHPATPFRCQHSPTLVPPPPLPPSRPFLNVGKGLPKPDALDHALCWCNSLGARLPQRHAWIIDEVSKSRLPTANRKTIFHDRSFVAWPVRLHRHDRSSNWYCLQTRTTTSLTLYHLALFFPGKEWSARVSKEVVSGPEAITTGPVMSAPRRIVLEAIEIELVGSQPPWVAGSVPSDNPSVHSCIPCRDQATYEESLAV